MTNFRELKESIQRKVLDVGAALQKIEDPDSESDQEIWDMMTDIQDALGELEEWYEELVGRENNGHHKLEDDFDEEV